MKENSDLKKVRVLYVLVIGLKILISGMLYYIQKRLDSVEKHAEANSKMAITLFQRLNNVIELNYLDTDNYQYLVNPKDWEDSLKKQTGLSLDIPNSWTLEKIIVRVENNKKNDSNNLDEYYIFLTKSETVSFKEFVDNLYNQIHDNFEGEVLSFSDEKKYYAIKSFSEATYNNMYYDYVTYQSDGSYGGPRIKVKVLDDESGVKIEINKF